MSKQIKIQYDNDTYIVMSAYNYDIMCKDKEIERLNDLVHSLRESRLQEHQENIELQDRISKAIEYIESYMPNYDFDKTNLIKVLDILKGVDKE